MGAHECLRVRGGGGLLDFGEKQLPALGADMQVLNLKPQTLNQ